MGERTGVRSLTYSRWHRPPSLAVHLEAAMQHVEDGWERHRTAVTAAARCTMVDVDAVEYCSTCSEPLALIETKHSSTTSRSTRVMDRLAARAQLPSYLVEFATDDEERITGFDVSGRTPTNTGDVLLLRTSMSPAEYASFVLGIHRGCPWECWK